MTENKTHDPVQLEVLVHHLKNQATVAGGTAETLLRLASEGNVPVEVLTARLRRIVAVVDRMHQTLDELENLEALESSVA